MHRYRIVAQISLMLSIFNLVLAAPMIVQEIHARGNEMGVAETSQDAMAPPQHSSDVAQSSQDPIVPPQHSSDVAEASQDGMASPQHSSDAAEASHDAMASPQHSLDGSTSSGYPTPHLSSDSSESGYSWMLDRPPRPSPNRPASLHIPPNWLSTGGSRPQPPPTETLADNAESTMMKKIKILAGVTIIGGAIAAIIAGSHAKSHKHRDFQDS